MNGIVFEEQSAQAMINEIIAEVQSKFLQKTAEERAFILIKGFCDALERIMEEGDVMPDQLSDEFFDWFRDPRNRSAKDRALERVIEMEDEKLRECGFSCDQCSLPSGAEQEMPDFDRLKRITETTRTTII